MAETAPVIDIEIRPDGSVHFKVSGAPGPACEHWEKLILAALRGEVVERVRTAEYFEAPVAAATGAQAAATLKRP